MSSRHFTFLPAGIVLLSLYKMYVVVSHYKRLVRWQAIKKVFYGQIHKHHRTTNKQYILFIRSHYFAGLNKSILEYAKAFGTYQLAQLYCTLKLQRTTLKFSCQRVAKNCTFHHTPYIVRNQLNCQRMSMSSARCLY